MTQEQITAYTTLIDTTIASATVNNKVSTTKLRTALINLMTALNDSKAETINGVISSANLPELDTTDEFINTGTSDSPILSLNRAYLWQQADFTAAVQSLIGGGSTTPGVTPTGLVVNDTAKTLAWTMNSGETFADFDFTQDAGSTFTTATANPMTVSTLPNAINRVGVRRKAKGSVTVSSFAYNQTAYTGTSSSSLISGHTLIDPTTPASTNISGRAITLTSSGVYASTSTDQSDNPALTQLKLSPGGELALDITSRGVYTGIIETGQGINNEIVIGLGLNTAGGSEYTTRDGGGVAFTPQPIAGDKIVMRPRTGGQIFDFYYYRSGSYGSIIQTIDVGFAIALNGAPVKATYDTAPASHSNNMSGKGLTAI